MADLPFDVLDTILRRLPAKCLLRLRSVCLTWKRIIDDPFFVKSHTKYQQHSYASTILIRKRHGGALFSLRVDCRRDYSQLTPLKNLIHRGVPRLGQLPAPSCNGLILLSHHDVRKSWAIWNPLVQDFHELPPPPSHSHINLARCGFGYDDAADDYKVVRVDAMYRDKRANHVYHRTLVYSLKSRCWREIEGFPGGDCFGNYGAFFNGALHWRTQGGIIALHLGKGHRHRVLRRPMPSVGKISSSLDAFDGCLVLSYGSGNLGRMEAWVMEKEELWTKLLSVESKVRGLRIVGYLKSKGQVFLRQYGGGLLWLDLHRNCAKEISVFDVPNAHTNEFSYAQFHAGSLLRLDNTKTRRGTKRKRPYACFTNVPRSYYFSI